MKRFLIFLVLLGLALSCLACSGQESITFYYVREEPAYLFGVDNAVIVGESRDSAGNIQNLHSLLILYLHGPLNENFRSPFPRGTSLVAVQQDRDHLTVRLSSIASAMKGTDLTLPAPASPGPASMSLTWRPSPSLPPDSATCP